MYVNEQLPKYLFKCILHVNIKSSYLETLCEKTSLFKKRPWRKWFPTNFIKLLRKPSFEINTTAKQVLFSNSYKIFRAGYFYFYNFSDFYCSFCKNAQSIDEAQCPYFLQTFRFKMFKIWSCFLWRILTC